ncbi:IS30 family transposase ISSau1 [Fusobacterium necrophorum]|nr:IS30 family transposase ISSau1 [Fusobacterium necrophorum]MBR8791070.1 IS30 family transposase ISSau1 [Fusobacterium necrophorum]
MKKTWLRRKGKKPKSRETRGKSIVGRSIHERSPEVQTRTSFGHWELDTMVSSRGQSKGCFATFVERKTRFYLAILIQDRSKHSMMEAMRKVIDSFPKGSFQSITSDRGKEFACYREIEELGIPFYFADSYCAWQRGSNENSNGLLREFFPKRTDLSKVEIEELQKVLLLLNHRPRKCLGFKTPFEMLFHEISKIT